VQRNGSHTFEIPRSRSAGGRSSSGGGRRGWGSDRVRPAGCNRPGALDQPDKLEPVQMARLAARLAIARPCRDELAGAVLASWWSPEKAVLSQLRSTDTMTRHC
jgi:hypothetical protein